jgi:hypothetical protein
MRKSLIDKHMQQLKNQQPSYISTAVVDLFYNACIKGYKLKRMVFY